MLFTFVQFIVSFVLYLTNLSCRYGMYCENSTCARGYNCQTMAPHILVALYVATYTVNYTKISSRRSLFLTPYIKVDLVRCNS